MIGPLLGVLALVAAVVLYRRRRGIGSGGPDTPRVTRNCAWIATGDPDRRLREYRCETCGVTGYSASGGPPVECKKDLR